MNLKISFMGSLAGLGDTIWQGVFLPLMLTLSIQDKLFDAICPNLLPLLLTLFVYYLLKHREWNSLRVILLMIGISVIGGLTGILVY